jgi:hypothetical protein
MFVLCDGTVRSISVSINLNLLTNLAVRDDGLPSGQDF